MPCHTIALHTMTLHTIIQYTLITLQHYTTLHFLSPYIAVTHNRFTGFWQFWDGGEKISWCIMGLSAKNLAKSHFLCFEADVTWDTKKEGFLMPVWQVWSCKTCFRTKTDQPLNSNFCLEGLAPTFAATAVLSNFHIFHVHPQVLLGLSSQVPFGDAETAPVGPGAQWERTWICGGI